MGEVRLQLVGPGGLWVGAVMRDLGVCCLQRIGLWEFWLLGLLKFDLSCMI